MWQGEHDFLPKIGIEFVIGIWIGALINISRGSASTHSEAPPHKLAEKTL